jgi:hypothetical protein
MSARSTFRHSGMRIALTLLAVSIAVTTWTLVSALRAEAIPELPPASVASLQGTARLVSARPRADIAAIVDNDIFSPDRSAPAAPYRMPGEPDPNDKPVAMPQKPVLLGTGVSTDNHNFATVQFGGDRPTLVHVGDKIGDWVVKAIERNKIVLVTAGGTRVDVSVPKPGT